MKKLLLTLGTAGATLAPLATTIACGKDDAGYFFVDKGNAAVAVPSGNEVTTGEHVSIIADGGDINDKSFNESALNAAKELTDADETKGFKTYKPAGYTLSDFNTAYTAAASSATKTLSERTFVLPGFLHGAFGVTGSGDSAIHDWITDNDTTMEGHYIGLDIADSADDNFYGLTFQTEESAFLAAFELGFQLNKQFANEGSSDAIKVATFGGLQIPSVTAFMNGYADGISYFNTIAELLELREMELIHVDETDKSKDFSGNFNPGGGTDIANNLINQGARAIMAVAGPQTGDVVSAIKAKGDQGKVFAVGVDVDQSATYGGVVIGSAVKGLADATLDTLENIYGTTATAVDKHYTLADNTADYTFIGYTPNENYESGVSETNLSGAKAVAEAKTTGGTWSTLFN